MARIHVLHENAAWVEPLRDAFVESGQPYAEWFLHEGVLRFDQAPPEGVFYNRMSASSHTRGHRYAPELTHGVLNWLEAHGRRVVNGSRALYLEVSKLAQYAALGRAGVLTPRTIAAVGRDKVLEAAGALGPGPYILKPNRGGKGLGVQLFQSTNAIAGYLDGPGMTIHPCDSTDPAALNRLVLTIARALDLPMQVAGNAPLQEIQIPNDDVGMVPAGHQLAFGK